MILNCPPEGELKHELEMKVREYEGRLRDFMEKQDTACVGSVETNPYYVGTLSKLELSRTVLARLTVDSDVFRREYESRNGSVTDRIWNEVVVIIDNYTRGDLRNLTGGTGLGLKRPRPK